MRAFIGAALLCAAGLAHAQLEARDLTGDGVADAFYGPTQNQTGGNASVFGAVPGFFYVTTAVAGIVGGVSFGPGAGSRVTEVVLLPTGAWARRYGLISLGLLTMATAFRRKRGIKRVS